MKFQTFTVVVGTKACNARCPFCISAQTGFFGTPAKVNWRNFHIACNLALKANTTTVLLTGKGEPTLYPDNVTETLVNLKKYNFPLVEIQTNGISIAEGKINDTTLKAWYDLGLTTIAISVVHLDAEKNRTIYQPHKPDHYDLDSLINKLHGIGFSIRLCVMMLKGYIETSEDMKKMINYCKLMKVEQLTFRNIVASEVTENKVVNKWTNEHALDPISVAKINEYIQDNGTLIQHLMHGMDVYDVDGQNVCLGNCLTRDPENKDDFRQLIFFPDGDFVFISAYALRTWGPRKGDVVVFRDRDDVLVIKRIVRVSGEVDDVTPFAKGRILGTNEYVVLGDNTNNSMDSRTYGTIVREQMIGIVK